MFEVNVSDDGGIAVVAARGRIDSSTAADFGSALTGAIDRGMVRVVVDLGQVDYMSSAGLREIVSALKRARKGQGDVRLAEPAARVLEVLEMAGLDTIMSIFPTRDDALKSF